MQPRRRARRRERGVAGAAPGDGRSGWRVPGCMQRRPSKVNSGPSVRPDRSSGAGTRVGGEQFADAGPCGTRRLLPNLPPRTTSRLRSTSTSAEPQPACLARAQPEAVTEREDGVVGRAAVQARGLSGTRPPPSTVDAPAHGRTGTAGVRPSRDARGSASAGTRQHLLDHGPVEQAGDDAERDG